MKKLFLSLLTLVLTVSFLTSCGGVSAIEFNDTIVDAQSDIIKRYEKVADAFGEGDKALLKSQVDSAMIAADKGIETVKGLEIPKGGEVMSTSVLEVFEMYKKITAKFGEAANLSEDNVDEYNTFVDELNKLVDEGDALEDKFIAAQKDFAKLHNMQLR